MTTGDFDGDQDVDGADFLAWQRGLGTAAPNAAPTHGDADGDRDVDAADLLLWADHFGETPAVAAAALGGMQAVGSAVASPLAADEWILLSEAEPVRRVAAGGRAAKRRWSALRPARYRRMEVVSGRSDDGRFIGPGIAESRDAGGHSGVSTRRIGEILASEFDGGLAEGSRGMRPQSPRKI